MSYIDHLPIGQFWCRLCGKETRFHRTKHKAQGDPCAVCGLPAANHRERTRSKREKKIRKYRLDSFFVGLDGEGKDDGPLLKLAAKEGVIVELPDEKEQRRKHRYIMLAAKDEYGQKEWVLEEDLTTERCLEFILALPRNAKPFTYSFGYDLTKILADLPDILIYRLFRPELRQHANESGIPVPRAVEWLSPTGRLYHLNLQGTKFSVRRGKLQKTVWDLFRFFQKGFVGALTDWKIGTPEELKRMQAMKSKRSEFGKLVEEEGSDGVRRYCLDECQKMGQLARKLTTAHIDAGIPLKSYYGAGSTSGAILKLMNIDEHNRETPEGMRHAVACGFFGGRFDHSVIGIIEGPIYGKDISSAYPYHLRFLPCLNHAKWSLTKDHNRMRRARHALVRYALGDLPKGNSRISWGPFPFRCKNGSIVFPGMSGGGWVWRDEYLAGEKLFYHVHFREAWVLESDCDCVPFERIPEFYRERLRLGKEGAGMVLKYGPNGCYGKLAQSVGLRPPFQCWIWAGMITSGCRAQVLELAALHKDLSNMLAVATDGVYTREKLPDIVPRDTGTFDCVNEKGESANKPLGGWEEKTYEKGIFFARPGIYFPVDPTDKDIEKVRARGVGRSTLYESWKLVVDAWLSGKDSVKLPSVSRFWGAKSSVSFSNGEYKRSSRYGQWTERPVECSFDPEPKRKRIIRHDGGRWGTLTVRMFNRSLESLPYKRGLISKEAIELILADQERAEQPDGDVCDYEVGDEC